MESEDKMYVGTAFAAAICVAVVSMAVSWQKVATKDSITAPECRTLCAPHPVASLDTKNCVCGSQPKAEVP